MEHNGRVSISTSFCWPIYTSDCNCATIRFSAVRTQMADETGHDMKLLTPHGINGGAKPPTPVVDKTLSGACDIIKLLPTGTVLAFHALAPSFSNHGACGSASRYLTLALIGACAASCVLLSFTDSLVGRDGRLYYGVATPRGFYPFNFDGTSDERSHKFGDLPRMKVRALDFVHALISAALFVVVALGNAGIQSCLFPDLGTDLREVLTNLPVGLGFLSSVVFMIFPTTRKSIGYTDLMPHQQEDDAKVNFLGHVG
ncbi:protein DMP4-like [Phragmites australis]|uniref:protein DMP4-like n=1 Tax=Phragmites australis TaxID=29695 RepID=UPI002D77E02B|nr:protein DMP4-like [Phragmites australis]